MARRFRNTALVVSLAVATVACSSGGDDPIDEPTPTESAAPTEEPDPDPTETEPDDPFAIPDEIDKSYAQSIVDELFASNTKALVMAIRGNGGTSIPPEAQPLVAETASGPLRLRMVESLQDAVLATNIDEVYLPLTEIGVERFHVLDVLESSDECFVLTGEYDLSEVARSPYPPGTYSILTLTRSRDDRDVAVNPTPWLLYDEVQLLYEGEPASVEQVESATFEDLEAIAQHTCDGGEA